MAPSTALPVKDMIAVRAIVARVRAPGRQRPLLLTGKNARAAAEAIAAALGDSRHRVDLASIVSKYIGETEKNLKRVFDAAAQSRLLLFDEADALFGARTEVKDSHDRHANAETDYLLQCAETYRGLAILVSRSQRRLPTAVRERLSILPFPRR